MPTPTWSTCSSASARIRPTGPSNSPRGCGSRCSPMTRFGQTSVRTTTIRHHTEPGTATTAHNARLHSGGAPGQKTESHPGRDGQSTRFCRHTKHATMCTVRVRSRDSSDAIIPQDCENRIGFDGRNNTKLRKSSARSAATPLTATLARAPEHHDVHPAHNARSHAPYALTTPTAFWFVDDYIPNRWQRDPNRRLTQVYRNKRNPP